MSVSPCPYSSFEINMLAFNRSHPVFVVIYRPPKYDNDFLSDFSDLLAGLMPKYDGVLIVGDFNIHFCCNAMPMVKDFLSDIESFNLVQSITDPTHRHGHTLDLVLSCGIPVDNIDVCPATFSDHMPVIFEIPFPSRVKLPTERLVAARLNL